MEMKFRFNNGEVLILDVFDTAINQKMLELWERCRADNLDFISHKLARDIGRKDPPGGDLDAALEKIRKGYELTGITPPMSLDEPLSIQDCNVIHRTFTNAFEEHKYNVPDLQLINHGAHEYESLLPTPNYIKLHEDTPSDTVAGYNIYTNMAKYSMDILYRDKINLPVTADVYLYDECRIGRSFSDAWCQDDNPKNWDIRDVDRAGPLLLFQNAVRKKLYMMDSFHRWLEKYDAQDEVYRDIPFANIVKGSYNNIVGSQLMEIEW